MRPELIEKINALAKKQKEVGLTEEEKKIQKQLRDEYLREFRKSFRARLENLHIEREE